MDRDNDVNADAEDLSGQETDAGSLGALIQAAPGTPFGGMSGLGAAPMADGLAEDGAMGDDDTAAQRGNTADSGDSFSGEGSARGDTTRED